MENWKEAVGQQTAIFSVIGGFLFSQYQQYGLDVFITK